METLTCKRCNHAWLPRVLEVKECPKCKSRNWNKSNPEGETLEIVEPEEKKEELQEKPVEPIVSIFETIFKGLGDKR